MSSERGKLHEVDGCVALAADAPPQVPCPASLGMPPPRRTTVCRGLADEEVR